MNTPNATLDQLISEGHCALFARDKKVRSLSRQIRGVRRASDPQRAKRFLRSADAPGIWSWAVSVFEMFTGILWQSGVFAKPALEQFRQRGLQERSYPPMTPALYEVLRQCFRTAPENRPASMSQIAAGLIDIYAKEHGESYGRQPPDTDLLACDALNNRAVSLLDLGKQEKAMEALEEALRSDPLHPEATFNHDLVLLRAARISDETLLGKLQQAAEADPATSVPLQLVARVHMERGRAESALLILRSAEAVESDEGQLRAIKRLMTLAASPGSLFPPEIARAFVHAVPRTGAQVNRDAAALKRLLSKAHAAHQAGRAGDALRYLDRLREVSGSKRHPEVLRLEEILWRKGKAET